MTEPLDPAGTSGRGRAGADDHAVAHPIDSGSPARLRVEGATVAFGDLRAVDGVDLAVAPGEVVAALGPSGCGKSTLLRAVAGLQVLDAGRVLLDDEDQARVPTHRRRVGLMFQDHALFPHRDVAANVAFGLRMAGVPAPAARARVDELLAMVGLPDAGPRAVPTLSGGEQQRVALARALAPSPRLLMLDEPFGSLDRALRERLVGDLGRTFRELGTTAIAVTHDQHEAFALADRIVVMAAGRVLQTGSPTQVWQRPASVEAARVLALPNVVAVEPAGPGRWRGPWGTEVGHVSDAGEAPGGLLVRPTSVRLHDEPAGRTPGAADGGGGSAAEVAVPGALRVVTVAFAGDRVRVGLAPVEHEGSGHPVPDLVAEVPTDVAPSPGEVVRARIDRRGVLALPA